MHKQLHLRSYPLTCGLALVPLGANNPNANNGVFYFNGNNDASNSNNNYAARLNLASIKSSSRRI